MAERKKASEGSSLGGVGGFPGVGGRELGVIPWVANSRQIAGHLRWEVKEKGEDMAGSSTGIKNTPCM